MVAEDIEILREDLIEALESQEDFEVSGEAASGKEIIEKVEADPPEIVIMDIEMESLNSGIKATEHIKRQGIDTKVIYYTAHETRETVLTAMATGAVDYVVKSESYTEIFRHIRAVANNKPLMEGIASNIILEEYQRLKQSEKSLLYFINNISSLTISEREIVALLLQGMKIGQIAKERSVEIVTVKSQITSILRKFGVSRTREVVKLIRELKLGHLF